MDAKSIVTACDGEVELVSIHAPVMDAKTVATTTRHSNVVSIHAPVMDAKKLACQWYRTVLVSIHAPVMDANIKGLSSIAKRTGFNPRARDGREDIHAIVLSC